MQVDTTMPLTVKGVGIVELTARIKVTDVRLEAGKCPFQVQFKEKISRLF
jgi:hypothetical protein